MPVGERPLDGQYGDADCNSSSILIMATLASALIALSTWPLTACVVSTKTSTANSPSVTATREPYQSINCRCSEYPGLLSEASCGALWTIICLFLEDIAYPAHSVDQSWLTSSLQFGP